MPHTAAQRASVKRTPGNAQSARDPGGSNDPAAYVETYGCQMNISDGELMEGILEEGGFRIVDHAEEADVIIVNTCAIREHAERRVLGRVAHLNGLREEKPELIIGVAGCMAQRLGTELLDQARHVDLVIGPDGYRSLPGTLTGLMVGDRGVTQPGRSGSGSRSRPKRQLAVLDLDPRENYAGLEQRRTSRVSAWVPIQRGCDHRCTYCIVPYVRGPEKNRSPADVLAEIRDIVAVGLTEVTLLGQTVNSYESEGVSFPDLLRDVARIDGIRRVRFTSPHPNDVTGQLIEVMATEPAVCEQLHLPVQSGNDRTLKRMLRRYTVKQFLSTVDEVRAAVPDIALSTDVIVGFPGESEQEFQDTLDLMREVRFDDAFTYKYSLREGTPATRLPKDQFVPDEIAQRRLATLIDVCRGIQAEINAGEVGRVEELLVERPGRDTGSFMGRTRRAKVAVFQDDHTVPGEYVTVRLDSTTGATFVGTRLVAAGAGVTTVVA